jgi:hypothetical protein
MLKRLWRLHVDDGLNLLWVALDSSFRDVVAQQLAYRYSEGILLRVELDAIPIKVGESFSQIVKQAVCLRGLDDDVIDIDLDIMANLFLQACLRTPLIGSSCVLSPERHLLVAVYPVWGDEHRLVLVFDL